MKLFIFFVTITLNLNAQSAFSDGKIDTHGGKSYSYTNSGISQHNSDGKNVTDLSWLSERKNEAKGKSPENTKSKKLNDL